MILDKLMTFCKPEDGAISETKALCLAQGDLASPNDGIAPYSGLFLQVSTYTEPVSDLTVKLMHCDTKDGDYEEVFTSSPKTAGAGEVIIKAPIPFKCKNWLKLEFSSASTLNAFLTHGVDKGGTIHND